MKLESALLGYLFMAAAVVIGLAFASYGVITTATWAHLQGQRVTVVVTTCRDLGRNGMYCQGPAVEGASPGAVIDHLPYNLSSVGTVERVWESGGSAVVGTPWAALWIDLLLVIGLVLATKTAVSRWRRPRTGGPDTGGPASRA